MVDISYGTIKTVSQGAGYPENTRSTGRHSKTLLVASSKSTSKELLILN